MEWDNIPIVWDDKIEEVTPQADIEDKVMDDRKMKRFIRSEEWHGKVARSLNDLCGIPAKGEEFLICTEKSFNAYALVRLLLETGDVIDELHLAIYRISLPVVEAITGLLDSGKIRKATFIISSFFRDTKRPEAWALMLCDYCKEHPDTTTFAYLHNHSKVMCARRGDDHYYFEGSGNMSDNARIEQYRYGNDKGIYDFHCGWMEDVISKVKDR